MHPRSLSSLSLASLPCGPLSSEIPVQIAIGTSRVSRWIQDRRLVSICTFGPPREPSISLDQRSTAAPKSRARFQTRPWRFKVSRWILHQRPTLIASAGARAYSPVAMDRPIQDRRPTNLHVVWKYGFPELLKLQTELIKVL